VPFKKKRQNDEAGYDGVNVKFFVVPRSRPSVVVTGSHVISTVGPESSDATLDNGRHVTPRTALTTTIELDNKATKRAYRPTADAAV